MHKNLYLGYIAKKSLGANLQATNQTWEERVAHQRKLIKNEVGRIFENADLVRVYGLDAALHDASSESYAAFLKFKSRGHDLEYKFDENLSTFLVDSGRDFSYSIGETHPLSRYDDVLCFFSTIESIPMAWCSKARLLVYYVNSYKGMNARAISELKKYVKVTPNGCVIAVCFTALRTTLVIFPGELAMESMWRRLEEVELSENPLWMHL
jgi:hypothetical protein